MLDSRIGPRLKGKDGLVILNTWRSVYICLILAVLAVPVLGQPVTITDDYIYEIRSKHDSSKCIDIRGNSTASEALAQVYTCHGGLNQRWKLLSNGSGHVSIVAMHSGKCLDVKSSDYSNGRNVQQFTCHGRDNQLWQPIFDNGYEFVVKHSNKCLHASQGQGWPWRREDLLEQFDCDDDPWQKWLLTPVAFCGDSICETGEGENASNCQADCGPVCGNWICEAGESCATCSDCGPCPIGCNNDGFCDLGEDTSCSDCLLACDYDGFCDLGEDASCSDCCSGSGIQFECIE